MPAPPPTHSSLWIPILLGTILFVAQGGLSILAPSNTAWLMRGLLDPETNLFGWEYFRKTPWLQFPLGANPEYGMELGSSIVFSDSLPLFALPFKLLDPLLPETFQYFGLWVLTCILLHAVFSYLLLAHFISNRWLLGLGTALLLLLPPYLMRFTIHLALGGQWLLLAGLYLYFSPVYRARFWLLMLVLATLTHAYLLVMLAAIWGADLLQRLLGRQLTLGQCIRLGLAGSAVIVSLMWCLGYFMLGSSSAAGQYGRMNLLALFDPAGRWSRVFPDARLTHDPLDGDGFAYMGVGMLGLLAIASLLQGFTKHRRESRSVLIWPIAVVALLLLLISLTNTVKLGNHVLLEYELPQWVIHLYQTFRSPGRLFWPVVYLLSLMAIVTTCTRLRPSTATCLLVPALCLQIYDLSGALKGTRDFLREEPVWITPLASPLWEQLGQHYEKVLYIKPMNVPPDFVSLTDFAHRHGMPINSGYLARTDGAAEAMARMVLTEQVKARRYDPTAIYVFNDHELWNTATRTLSTNDQVGILDGVRLLLPETKQCPTCSHPDFLLQRWGVWEASQLPTVVGRVHDGALLAQRGDIGYLNYGPYTPVPAGTYLYLIAYKASAAPESTVGHWDIVSSAATAAVVHSTGELTGTNGEVRNIKGVLEITEDIPNGEIRTFTNGSAAVELISIQLRPTQPDTAKP